MEPSESDELQLVGRVVSHYRITERVGGGGMGVVYKAHDIRLNRTAALKFLSSDLTRASEARRRFIHEAQAASALDHNNVCTIYEIDEFESAGTFIAMAFYDGSDLKAVIDRGPLPVDEAVRIAQQICDGLARAHERGIIHRDIKPANILVTTNGVVKIVDFGLAKLTGATQITEEGTPLGTVTYMAPEQVRGDTVDLRADVWSVGVVIYEMLAGAPPFQGGYPYAVMYQVLNEDPRPLRELRGDVPEALVQAVERCLEKDPALRPSSLMELRDALSGVRSRNADDNREISPRETLGAWFTARRPSSPYLILAAAAILVVLAMGLALSSTGRSLSSWFGGSVIPEARHLAVLPFRNVAGDQESAAFCSGLMETIVSKLSQLEQFSEVPFWVVPASDVLESSVQSASDARGLFGVNLVIEGSVNRMADGVRVTLNLVDPASQRTLGSHVVDNVALSGLQVQDEVVVRIIEMLRMQFDGRANRVIQAGGTAVPGANEYYLQGRGYLNDYQEMEHIELAIRLFERALHEDSTFALAYAGLAEANWRLYRATRDASLMERVRQMAAEALRLDSQLAPVRIMLGNIHLEQGEYADAMQAFRKALEIDPQNADAYRGRASVFEARGDIQSAELALKKAIELKPSYWAGYDYLGSFYYNRGEYDDAAAQWKTVVELTPESGVGYRKLGAAYWALQQHSQAIDFLTESVTLSPSYAGYSNLATMYYYTGRYAEAAETYRLALSENDRDYRVWGSLAESYHWLGQNHRARSAFQEALERALAQLELNPSDPTAAVSIAGYYARLGRRQQALEMVDALMAMDVMRPEIYFQLGSTYETLGMREKALEWIERAIAGGFTLSAVEGSRNIEALRDDPRYEQIKQRALTQNEE